MKKIISCLFLLFLLTGCKNNQSLKLHNEIHKKKESYISIHYPITENKRLNQQLEDYIEKRYQAFHAISKYSKRKEFNVSTQYQTSTTLINTVINVFYTCDHLLKPSQSVTSFVFSKTKQRQLNLEDILTKEDQDILKVEIKEQLRLKSPLEERLQAFLTKELQDYTNFSFDDEHLILFFNSCYITPDLLTLSIPLTKFNLKQDVTFDQETKEEEVIKQIKNKIIDPEKPVIAFTFDDGPSQWTEEILQVFENYQGSGTFFVIGNKVDLYQDVMKKMVKLGHEIGNHSYNHQWMSRMGKEELEKQIEKTQQKIHEVTGYTPTRVRPTYGSLNKTIEKYTNLTISLWNVDPKDWKYKDSKTIANRILKKAEDEAVVLLHDTHKRSVEALKIVLKELKKEGYQFVTLSELDEIKLLRKTKMTS